MKCEPITEEAIASLRERVKPYLTEKRYAHTLSVEREAAKLGAIYLPDKIMKLRASALLHDITKRYSDEKQLQCCKEFGIITDMYERVQTKTLHAKTAAEVAKRDFPEFADPEIISGIRWHTTGHAGMTCFESIVYLSDYIEETRTFDDCVKLRSYFYDRLASAVDINEKNRVFEDTMIMSFDKTVELLIADGEYISTDTIDARNYFISVRSGK